MTYPAIATMYLLRDTLAAALPYHAAKKRVPGARDRFALVLGAGDRLREIAVHARTEDGALYVTATVSPYGRELWEAGTDSTEVALVLAERLARLLQRSPAHEWSNHVPGTDARGYN